MIPVLGILLLLAVVGCIAFLVLTGLSHEREFRSEADGYRDRDRRTRALKQIGEGLRIVTPSSEDEAGLMKALDELEPSFGELKQVGYVATGGGKRASSEIESLLRSRMVKAVAVETTAARTEMSSI